MGTDTTNSPTNIDQNRGIQNAQSRFEQRAESRLLSEQLQNPAVRPRRQKQSSNQSFQRKSRFSGTQTLVAQAKSIQTTFRSAGEDISIPDIEILQENNARKQPLPSFPYFIFTIALIKDIFDMVATISLFGMILTPIFSFLCSLILFFWTLGKISGWLGFKKKLITGAIIRFFGMFAIELIPGVNFLPVTTIYVLLAHYRETKMVKLINKALEIAAR